MQDQCVLWRCKVMSISLKKFIRSIKKMMVLAVLGVDHARGRRAGP